mmetsp:Transcript_42104/g.88353  ORF Transcript_42104/g.88353 Transcript_42104/m.88353 type:complete len:241 (+) Transcript_42104:68-790(+)
MANQSTHYPSINELDSIDYAIKLLIVKGGIDVRRFAKLLPQTSRDLRDGKVTPEQVTADLISIYNKNQIEYECIRGVRLNHDHFIGVSIATTAVALPDKFFNNAQKQNVADKTTEAFQTDIGSLLLEKSMQITTFGRVREKSTLALILKESIDEICEKWADKLDEDLFRGKKGCFLKKCPLYGIEPRRYSEHKMPLDLICRHSSLNIRVNYKAELRECHYLAAMKRVSSGLYGAKKFKKQ